MMLHCVMSHGQNFCPPSVQPFLGDLSDISRNLKSCEVYLHGLSLLLPNTVPDCLDHSHSAVFSCLSFTKSSHPSPPAVQTRGGTETSISFGNYSPDTVLQFLFLRTSNQFVQWYTGTSCTIISVVFSLEHCPPCLQILEVSLKAVSTKQIIQQEVHELGLDVNEYAQLRRVLLRLLLLMKVAQVE
jgi:hypothetical protein